MFIKLRLYNVVSVIIAGIYACSIQAQTISRDSIGNEQPVRIAYGSQQEWMITGAVSTVSGEELSKSFTTNVANTLYGRLPGLTVQQQSGEAGADAPLFNIRGLNTFGQGQSIYIVIDGFPASDVLFQQLTPREIESITLLKDASATAIYGNKAANGVLLVTTKRGFETPLKLSFNVQYGFQQATRLPDFLDSYQYASLFNEALANDGLPARYSETDLKAYQTGSDPLNYPNVNWYREALRDWAPVSNYNLNASGGSAIVKYFVLFNIADNRGLYKRTEKFSDYTKDQSYTRYNFRTNIDVKLHSRFTVSANVGGTIEDKTNPGAGPGDKRTDGETTQSVFDLMASVAPNAFPVNVDGKPGGSALYRNPWYEITDRGYVSYNGRSALMSTRLTGDLGMITPGLSIAGEIGFNTYFKSYSLKYKDYARYSVSKDSDGNPIFYGQDTQYSADESKSYQWRNFALQGFLNYNRTFGVHEVQGMLMTNYNELSLLEDKDETRIKNSLPFHDIGLGGRFTYIFDKRYIGEFSFGYTGNDNFASGNRFGFFPAGSLGWVVSNEEFLKNNPALDFLKVRASYGLTGNSNIGGKRFMYQQYYDNDRKYYLGTDNNEKSGLLLQSALANPEVTWEKQKQWNAGIEMTCFKQLSVSFDWFNQSRDNILAQPNSSVPDYLGLIRPDMNVGKTENKGFEALIRYDGKTKDLTWFVEASAWYAKNKIVFNAEEPQLYEYLYSTGHSIYQPFGLEAIGIFKDWEEINSAPKQTFTDVQPGDIRYKNQNGDDLIDVNDLCAIGYTPLPEYTFGFRAGLEYKGFDLDLLFQGAMNRTVYWEGNYFHAFQNNGKVSSVALDRWTVPESSGKYPRLSSTDNLNNYQYSSFWQRNGDFLKLRNLEIGYTLPEKISNKIKVETARVFLNGSNLFSLDCMEGFTDPETLTGYPAIRTFSIGINIQL
jgi:TonB-linked SusC/RagA family outer membrane protein